MPLRACGSGAFGDVPANEGGAYVKVESASIDARVTNQESFMGRFLLHIFPLLMLGSAYAQTPQDAPTPTVGVTAVIIFVVIFVCLIVGFFWYYWWTEKKRKREKEQKK